MQRVSQMITQLNHMSQGLIRTIFYKFLFSVNFCSGCESETDTEEFEKVGQSPVDRRKLADGRTEAIVLKPESAEMATSTVQVETTEMETLTEVRIRTNLFLINVIFSTVRMLIHFFSLISGQCWNGSDRNRSPQIVARSNGTIIPQLN